MIPWKLLAFIAVMALVLVFVGFNLDNRCDISLVFVTFRSVPVVITILATYVLGLLSAFILSLGRLGSSRKRAPANRPHAASEAAVTGHAAGVVAPGAGASSITRGSGDQPEIRRGRSKKNS